MSETISAQGQSEIRTWGMLLVLEGRGLKVVPCLMPLNCEYGYDGHEYQLEQLFRIRDLTEETAALKDELQELIRSQRKMLPQAAPPNIGAGRQCTDPVTCQSYDVCNILLPQEHIRHLPSTTTLCRMSTSSASPWLAAERARAKHAN
jgi:hypothetical protein